MSSQLANSGSSSSSLRKHYSTKPVIQTTTSAPTNYNYREDTDRFISANSVEKLKVIDRVTPVISNVFLSFSVFSLPQDYERFPKTVCMDTLTQCLSVATNPQTKNKYGNLRSGNKDFLLRRLKQGTVVHFDSAEHFKRKDEEMKLRKEQVSFSIHYSHFQSDHDSTPSSSSDLSSNDNLKSGNINFLNNSSLRDTTLSALSSSSSISRNFSTPESRFTRTTTTYYDENGNKVSRLSSASIENCDSDSDNSYDDNNQPAPDESSPKESSTNEVSEQINEQNNPFCCSQYLYRFFLSVVFFPFFLTQQSFQQCYSFFFYPLALFSSWTLQ